jgi:hypothetical protein
MGCLLLRHTHEVYSLQLPTIDTCWKRSRIDWGQSLSPDAGANPEDLFLAHDRAVRVCPV